MYYVCMYVCMYVFSIMQVDLKKLGISSYGNIESQELGQCGNDKLELYFNKTVSQCLYVHII